MLRECSWWCHQMETFSAYWSFVRGIHRSPVNSPHKGQWRGALVFSLICVFINGWVNNREAGDLRRYRDHYDVIVLTLGNLTILWHQINWSTCILSVTRIYASLAFCIISRHRKKYLSDDREYCFLWQIGSRHQLAVYGWCPASVFVGCSRSFQIWKIHSSSHSTFIFATICYRIHMHDAIIWVHFGNALVDNRHLQCHTELILSDIFPQDVNKLNKYIMHSCITSYYLNMPSIPSCPSGNDFIQASGHVRNFIFTYYLHRGLQWREENQNIATGSRTRVAKSMFV